MVNISNVSNISINLAGYQMATAGALTLVSSGSLVVGSSASQTIALPTEYAYFYFDLFDVTLSAADYVDVQFSEDGGTTWHGGNSGDAGSDYQSIINEYAEPGFIVAPGGNGPQLQYSKCVVGRNGLGVIPFVGVFAGDKVLSCTNLTSPGDVSSFFESTVSVDGQIQQTASLDLSAAQILMHIQRSPGNIVNSQQNFFAGKGPILFTRVAPGYCGHYTVYPKNKASVFGQGKAYYASGYLQTQIISMHLETTTNVMNAMRLLPDGPETFQGGSWRLLGLK